MQIGCDIKNAFGKKFFIVRNYAAAAGGEIIKKHTHLLVECVCSYYGGGVGYFPFAM